MRPRLLLILSLLVLAACGSSDDHGDASTQVAAAPTTPSTTASPQSLRGTLLESPAQRKTSIPANQVLAVLETNETARQILDFMDTPMCGVDVHALKYNTVNPAGASTTASGALMIPTGTSPSCQGPRPILLYAHGTKSERSFDIADLYDPNNAEGVLLASLFTAYGYVVVAPNYAGYDSSSLDYHPYLQGDQQSKDMVDALTAARASLPMSTTPLVTDSGKLFISGYSQGGYVAMATHRLLQQSGAAVTASAPMSGPYAMAAFGDAIFYGRVGPGAPSIIAMLISNYQRTYGDVYASPTAVFEAPYASGIEATLPSAGPIADLYLQKKIPAYLFSSTPPDPAYAQYTPATEPALLAPVFVGGFGTDHLITNAYRLEYLQDAQAHPDGGFPIVTDNHPASAPANGLRKALKANDLRNWVPTSPVLLCAGTYDPVVDYQNTQLIQSYWSASGVTAPVTLLNLEDPVSASDPYASIKTDFAVAKATVASAGAALSGFQSSGAVVAGSYSALAASYHGGLVPPYCFAAVHSFFQGK